MMHDSPAATLALQTTSVAETESLGHTLGQLVAANDVLVLTGDLGAGKTHLSKGIAEGLGVAGTVSSPTFNILLVHEGGRLTLNHLDLYRLEVADDLIDIDFYDVIEQGGVTLVEWGDRFGEVTELADLTISIAISGDDDRVISLEPLSARGEEIVAALAESREGGVDE